MKSKSTGNGAAFCVREKSEGKRQVWLTLENMFSVQKHMDVVGYLVREVKDAAVLLAHKGKYEVLASLQRKKKKKDKTCYEITIKQCASLGRMRFLPDKYCCIHCGV